MDWGIKMYFKVSSSRTRILCISEKKPTAGRGHSQAARNCTFTWINCRPYVKRTYQVWCCCQVSNVHDLPEFQSQLYRCTNPDHSRPRYDLWQLFVVAHSLCNEIRPPLLESCAYGMLSVCKDSVRQYTCPVGRIFHIVKDFKVSRHV